MSTSGGDRDKVPFSNLICEVPFHISVIAWERESSTLLHPNPERDIR